jgi:hypothetical protein
MDNRERYLLKAIGDDLQATIAGVAKFRELCQKYGDGVIYVPTMRHVESTLLATAVGEKIIKALSKHQPVTLPTGQRIDLCSGRTFQNYTRGSVYLVLWATPDMIENVERGARACKAMVVVTWLKNDADTWISSQNPTQLLWK